MGLYSVYYITDHLCIMEADWLICYWIKSQRVMGGVSSCMDNRAPTKSCVSLTHPGGVSLSEHLYRGLARRPTNSFIYRDGWLEALKVSNMWNLPLPCEAGGSLIISGGTEDVVALLKGKPKAITTARFANLRRTAIKSLKLCLPVITARGTRADLYWV